MRATILLMTKPQIIEYSKLDSLKKQYPDMSVEDYVDLAIDELFDIDFPAKKDSKTAKEVKVYGSKLTDPSPNEWGQWVFYPWLNKLVHFPPKEKLRALRTSRNRNLITAEEQKKLYQTTLLIIGMSVGSNIVEALVAQGIGQKLILVDMDIIEPSNLNRIRSPYHHVGLHKVEAISRKVWEIDPFIEVVAYKNGLNKTNLKEITQKYKVNVIVDEMDDLRMKILVRETAKKYKLPVVMAADDGDNSLLDVERYDLNPDLALFSGLVPGEVLDRIKKGGIPRQELGMMIGKYFVGADNTPLRMFQSLVEVGKTLPSWPQIGGAAALSGIAVAYAIRRIILDQSLKEGRTLISIDKELDQDQYSKEHQAELKKFQKMIAG